MVSFETADGGLEIVDPIERRRYRLRTGRPVDSESPDFEPSNPVPSEPEPPNLEPVDPDRFYFPVDAAVGLATDEVTVDGVVDAYVRREDGSMVAELGPGTDTDLPPGGYELEINGPVKCYLRTDGALAARVGDDRMRFSFGSGEVEVGARSYHERPAATVTTTTDPEDALRAVSYLGSALKTTSPERSYPTLRGHPPTIEVGEAFEAPDALSKPDTGVEIAVPPTHRAAAVVAPLAFYLGAEVVPGDDPRIVADGTEFALDTPDFETGVERALKRSFFLDCLVRTEGYYRVDLHEREAVEPHLDLDLAGLYDASLADRLAASLSVPFERIAAHLPRWNLAAYVEPSPAGIEALSFVVGDLAIVRPATGDLVSPAELQSDILADFVGERTGSGDGSRRDDSRPDDARRGGRRRGGGDDSADRRRDSGRDFDSDGTDRPRLVRPDPVDAVERAWFGGGVPVGATKATTTAFRNKLDRRPDAGDIAIAVVSNDSEMRAEDDAVGEVYGARADLPFDVTVHRDLTTAEFRDVLASDADFLHYVGHVDDAGFECADDFLDARDLDEVGVGAFLLNACRSYEQGMALVAAGSVGGVVTLSDVIDSGAVRVGETMARLLNLGFPLRAALEIARGESIVGGHYIVVGDGRVAVVQEEGGLSMLCAVKAADGVAVDAAFDEEGGEREEGDGGEENGAGYDLTIRAYPPREGGMGTLIRPTVDDHHYLAPGPLGPFRLSGERLREYLDRHRYPVKKGGKLYWNPDEIGL